MRLFLVTLLIVALVATAQIEILEHIQDYNEAVLDTISSTSGALPVKCAQSPDIARIQFMITSSAARSDFVAFLQQIYDKSLELCKELKKCDADKANSMACSMGLMGPYMDFTTKLGGESPALFKEFNEWNMKLKAEGK